MATYNFLRWLPPLPAIFDGLPYPLPYPHFFHQKDRRGRTLDYLDGFKSLSFLGQKTINLERVVTIPLGRMRVNHVSCKVRFASLCYVQSCYIQWNITITLIPQRGWLSSPPRGFSLSPPPPPKSDLSHLGNLKYILCGPFDEKKSGVSAFRG